MKVKFKDGNIVDAVQLTKESFEDMTFGQEIGRLIEKIGASKSSLGITVMHDNSYHIEYVIGSLQASVYVKENDWVYYNPNHPETIFGIKSRLFELHRDGSAEEGQTSIQEGQTSIQEGQTSIQEDIKSLEGKVAEHLKDIGAVSVTFKIAGQPVVFEYDRNKETFKFEWKGIMPIGYK